MRRPRPHRLTGSVRRLLAAAVLGVLAAAVAVTATSGPASAAGLNVNLNLNPNPNPNLNLNILNLNLSGIVPGLPSLLPTLGATPPPAPTALPSLPNTGTIPLCPPNCASTPANNSGNSTANGEAPGSRTGTAGNQASRSSSSTGSPLGSRSVSSATSRLTPPQSLGLSISPPPPVDQLTPLAGISFGHAPYLWPLFLLLDAIAAGTVVLLVRRTWSVNSGAD
jgi:hypothetical protein